MIGGVLANPYNVGSREHIENPNLLQRFPYALPNIVSACFFTIGITTGVLFLQETLETLQGRRDWGLVLGSKLVKVVKSHTLKIGEFARLRSTPDPKGKGGEREPLLKGANDEENFPLVNKEPPPPPPSYSEVLNPQAVLNLVRNLLYRTLASSSRRYEKSWTLCN